MAGTYYDFTREEFELSIAEIAKSNNIRLGDFTEKQGKKAEERVYELTTTNPNIRILIYSSLSPSNAVVRAVGQDAVRVNLYCMNKGTLYYKRFKRHNRIETLFTNLAKTVAEINLYVTTREAKGWLYAVSKN